MALTNLEILNRAPYEGGTAFGETGPYERIDAVAHYAVDPTAEVNAGIVDLDLAPRGPDGLVTFEGDITMLRPVDPSRGQRAALVEVPNRGRRTAVSMYNRAPTVVEPTPEIDPGDGFLFRHGWTVAWAGWQWDVPRSPSRMGLTAPVVLDDVGEAAAAEVQLRLQLHVRVSSVDLTDHHVGLLGGHESLPTVDIDDLEARLMQRDGIWGEPEDVPRSQWRFARDESGRRIPDPSHVWLEGGFEPGRIYDLVYRTAPCRVVGTGLLAFRDLASFLRSPSPSNPCAGELDHLVVTGQSQCGRFLRTFLHLGLNQGEDRKPAYDGVLAHIAGGRRGEFNHRAAQPSVQPTPSFGHRFPFADDAQTDPQTGLDAGLLDRQRWLGCMPKIFYTNTSSEYWRGDASLAHSSVVDGSDIDPPPETRHYLFASTQHGSGMLPLIDRSIFGSHGGNCFNIVDYTPLMRAAVTNLLAWITDGTEPPPNAVPRTGDGTAVTRSSVLEKLGGVGPVGRPEAAGLWTIRPLDLGTRDSEGIGAFRPYRWATPTPA